MHPTEIIDRDSLRDDIPEFRPGDTVKVHVRVVEGTRERVQVFQGAVIARRGIGIRETFTVRKVSFGVGVERTFPVHAPTIGKIEVVNQPIKLSRTPSQVVHPTPEKGEHTEEALKAYGYDDKAIAEFRARKIV